MRKAFLHKLRWIGATLALITVTAFVSIASASLTFTGTTVTGDSNAVIDASGTISIGTSTATGITIGQPGQTVVFPGNVSTTNVTIAGLGTSGSNCLTVNAAGNVATTTCGGGGGSPGGSNTQVEYNNGGAFGGDANLTWSSSTAALTIASSSGSLLIGTSTLPANALFSIATSSNILTVLKNSYVQFGKTQSGVPAGQGLAQLQVNGSGAIANDSGIYNAFTFNPISNGNITQGATHSIFYTAIPAGVTNANRGIADWVWAYRNEIIGADDNGTLGNLYGIRDGYGVDSSATSSPITTNVFGIKLEPAAATGTIANLYDLYVATPSPSLAGVVGNHWGIYQQDTTAQNYFGGNVGIGITTASTTLQIGGTKPTIRIGNSALAGCLELGNSDGSAGINYITVLNGVLSATTTQPSSCQ